MTDCFLQSVMVIGRVTHAKSRSLTKHSVVVVVVASHRYRSLLSLSSQIIHSQFVQCLADKPTVDFNKVQQQSVVLFNNSLVCVVGYYMVRDESPLLSHPPQSSDNQSLSDLQTPPPPPPVVGGGWPVLVYNCEG